ncbi:MAG: hypothetical protein AAGF75_04615 [Cyanobacteria bacterium P01_H01_bin.130]
MGHTIESPLPFLGGEESFPPREGWPVTEGSFNGDLADPADYPLPSYDQAPPSIEPFDGLPEDPALVPEGIDDIESVEVFLDGDPLPSAFDAPNSDTMPTSPRVGNGPRPRNVSPATLNPNPAAAPPKPLPRVAPPAAPPPSIPRPPAVPVSPPVTAPVAPPPPPSVSKPTSETPRSSSPSLTGDADS